MSKKDDRKDKNLSERFSDDRELIAEMTIMNSDEFMTAVFQGAVEAAQEIVQIVREDKSLKVVDLFSQVTVGQLRRKNARFDVLVMDQNKQIYAFEFQKLDQKDLEQRSFEYAAQLTVGQLPKGYKAEDIQKVYIVFFTDFDAFGLDLPMYISHGALNRLFGNAHVNPKFG